MHGKPMIFLGEGLLTSSTMPSSLHQDGKLLAIEECAYLYQVQELNDLIYQRIFSIPGTLGQLSVLVNQFLI